MRDLRKISTFLALVLLISAIFAVSVVAVDEATSESDSESSSLNKITEKDSTWNVNCPSCNKNFGLKFVEKYFVCLNEECKAEFEFVGSCAVCGEKEFAQTEDGFYVCCNEKCTGVVITVDDLLSKLAIVEKETETEDDGKLDMNEKPEPFSARAIELALQGTATGMVMVFAVLGLLAIIVSLSRYILNNDHSKEKNESNNAAPAVAQAPVAAPAPEVVNEQDDGELAAVITAAIAAMIESGDYKNEFVGGFRVVSFKRSSQSSQGKAWNR